MKDTGQKRFSIIWTLLFFFILSGIAGAGTLKLPQTGQTTSYAAGDDGETGKGVAWPTPRFTNPDGTTPLSGTVVLDQMTGLMWARNANAASSLKTWQTAHDYVAGLNSGTGYGGYTGWRLPNINELESLVNAGASGNAAWLINKGFTNVQADYYWSSTSNGSTTTQAWVVNMYFGYLYYHNKTSSHYVWPVRSSQ